MNTGPEHSQCRHKHRETVVWCRQVSKTYTCGSTTTSALRDIDFELYQGDFAAIWGPSGSGKSTLCNLIGLLDEPCRGEIFFHGEPVSRFSECQRSEKRNSAIGMVFQRFNLVPVLSALENVMLPLQIAGLSSRGAKERACMALEEVGLKELIQKRPDKLSGGQQQRVAIARALINNPLLIVADEPTANLDSLTAETIINLMKETGQRRGTTFLFSTHDQRLLGNVTRQIQLQDGSITEDRVFI